jgi:hypothetical protein
MELACIPHRHLTMHNGMYPACSITQKVCPDLENELNEEQHKTSVCVDSHPHISCHVPMLPSLVDWF